MFRSIRWRIAAPYVALVLLTMLGLTRLATSQVRQTRLSDLESHLLASARLIADAARPLLAEEADAEAVNALVDHWSRLLGAQVVLIDAEGAVWGGSGQSQEQAGNALQWPEVRQALAEGAGSHVRADSEPDQAALFVAVPIGGEGRPAVGAARVAVSLRGVEAGVAGLRQNILLATLAIALVVVALAFLIAAQIARPVRRLTTVAKRIASGDFSARLVPTAQDEVGQLTRAFNLMTGQLQEEVSQLAEERSRLAAILQNMADGVLITDADGRVRLINPAAVQLLDTTEGVALGRTFPQVVRHHEIIDLWRLCREQGESQVGAVEIEHRGVFWQVIITSFEEANRQGYLVIVQDLSRIRRLETVRRDFISNISHELRTPLASLRALADTLRDGALDDPPAAQRFLDYIDTEVDAMTQTVEELLELSRIESGQIRLRLRPTQVADMLLPPIERLRHQAERAELALSVDLPADLPPVLADEERMQQVVANLVHNAIKFTPPGGEIAVRARLARDDQIPAAVRQRKPLVSGRWSVIIVAVADTGVGMPAKDLPRIFERFYKAGRGRGRGGTGLGLSIARHLVQSHNGYIWAESVERRGSTFYFSLPTVSPMIRE